jgi:hypothetical protein
MSKRCSMKWTFFYALVLVTAGYCTAQIRSPKEKAAVPLLVNADLPRYPPIAKAADLTGTIQLRANVKDGKVVEAEVLSQHLQSRGAVLKSGSPYLALPTIENLKTWRFGASVNENLVVTYTYEISGSETEGPTNPKIEILPSLDVHITARPVKPTVNY